MIIPEQYLFIISAHFKNNILRTESYIYQGSVEGGLGAHFKELKKVFIWGKLWDQTRYL